MRTALSIGRGLLALALLYGALVLPATPDQLAASWWWPLPVELAAIALLALWLPRPAFAALRPLVMLCAALLVLLKLADQGTFAAFNRSFNPLLDAKLPLFGWNVLSDSLGTPTATLALAAAVAVFITALALLAWGLGGLRRWPGAARITLAVSSLLVLATGLIPAPQPVANRPLPADARATRFAADRVTRVAASARDLSRFRATLARDPGPAVGRGQLFHRLAGKNVLLVFVESYGRSALDRPLYGNVIKPRLASFERKIAAAGFEARSGWLTSPTMGGQSWLAHGTLLSGLWVGNQARYDALLASRHPALNRLFRQGGWDTAAVMPAITADWPESAYFGYDRVYAAADLGYRGEPFNWVTMPDQYTLSAIEQRLLTGPRRQPVMIETALISSHAPWTPIPPLLEWDTIGNGRVFKAYANVGDPPAVVWQDADRVRVQYRKAIDYSLATLASFVAERADPDLVVIMLGDHQPAPLVAGDEATRDVPVHIISADPAVLAAIDDWHWQAGMIPNAATPVWPMDAFYERFVRAFSSAPATDTTTAHASASD